VVQGDLCERVLLLGLGNDLLCDDAVGLRVAAAIAERGPVRGLEVVATTEMGLSLLDLLVGFDRVVIVDSVRTSAMCPGCVREFDEQSLAALRSISPHFAGVGEMLSLGRALGMKMPASTTILAVEVADPLTVSTRMTPALEAALPGIIERVWGCLRCATAS
jgi:hydrogenase maturation protease